MGLKGKVTADAAAFYCPYIPKIVDTLKLKFERVEGMRYLDHVYLEIRPYDRVSLWSTVQFHKYTTTMTAMSDWVVARNIGYQANFNTFGFYSEANLAMFMLKWFDQA